MKNFINCFKQVTTALLFLALTSSAYFASAQYTVEWTDLVNVSTSNGGTTITKTGGFGHDGRAVSINELPECVDGTIEFTATNVSNQSRYIGFTTNGGSSTSDIKHGFIISYGYFYFLVNGTFNNVNPFSVSDGDRFKIERKGNQIILTAIDCSNCYTSSPNTYSISAPTTVWKVAGAIFNNGDVISNVSVNFAKPNTCNLEIWNRNNSTGALYNIYQSDNVGIGTLSPSERLDINGKARVRTLDVDNSLSNLVVADANGVLKKKTDPWTRDAANGLLYTTTGTDKLGIGTTTPTERLDVNGTARLRGIAEDNTLSRMLVTDANGVVKYKNLGGWFKQGTTTIPNAITDDIYTSGKVRIGQQLEVSSTISLWGAGIGGGTYDKFVIYADTANGLLFDAPRDINSQFGLRLPIKFGWRGDNDPTLIINPSKNVGIGTATPNSKLTVAGAVTPSTNNSSFLGNSTYRWKEIYCVNATINTSDINEKTNIQDLKYGIEDVMKLRPVTYNWKENDNGTRIGFIAQELEQVIGEVVVNEEGKYGVRYTEIIPVLVSGIKQQQEIITTQNQRIDQLEKEMEEIKAMIKNQSGSQPSQQKPGSTGSMNVVPNPTYGKTTVNYTISGDYANASVIVYNELGQKMGEYVITQKGNGSVEVDATSFAGGAYFCKLVVDENIREVKKFIVSK